ncbi:hypothetical protein [Pantoea ananatis]|uniref:hypothetical protein n=1 Tax=Pantoea ananas TaxID=553 RepID=UPI000241835D|nr:hypothetical protein PANA5342_2146 [Pantoea ananatis LMG 5342]
MYRKAGLAPNTHQRLPALCARTSVKVGLAAAADRDRFLPRQNLFVSMAQEESTHDYR